MRERERECFEKKREGEGGRERERERKKLTWIVMSSRSDLYFFLLKSKNGDLGRVASVSRIGERRK